MDREKVIKGLKLCVVTGDFCGECPYDEMELCIDHLHDDALALLKEQEPIPCGEKIEPDEWIEHHIRVEGYGKVYYQHTCRPELLENPYLFCPFCGKKMKSKDMT